MRDTKEAEDIFSSKSILSSENTFPPLYCGLPDEQKQFYSRWNELYNESVRHGPVNVTQLLNRCVTLEVKLEEIEERLKKLEQRV